MLRRKRMMARGIIAKDHHLNILKAHDPVSFRPAAVIANAHAHICAHGPPDAKTEIPDFEIALFKMLKWAFRLIVSVAGQMNLAIFANDPAGAIYKDRGVETPDL